MSRLKSRIRQPPHFKQRHGRESYRSLPDYPFPVVRTQPGHAMAVQRTDLSRTGLFLLPHGYGLTR
eukprot:56565-Eustigmatos_ZCMA.PRE.1